MPSASFLQTSFLGGEWSKYAQGRADKPEYRTALARCYNGLPVEEGAWVRRPGTKFAATTRHQRPGTLRAFHFASSAPYVIEFTDDHARFLQGDQLVVDTAVRTVAGYTLGIPLTLVETTGAHGWSTGDAVIFPDTPLLVNRPFYLTVVDATHFNVALPINIGPVGTARRVTDLSTVYGSGDWNTVRLVQDQEIALLLHSDFPPQALSAAAGPTFAIAAADFVDGPYLDPPTDGTTLTPGGTTSPVTLTASTDSFVATDVGRMVRMFSEPLEWDIGTTYNEGDTIKYNGAYFSSLVGTNVGSQPDTDITNWTIDPSAAAWTWGTVTMVNSATEVVVALADAGVDAIGLPTPAGDLLYTNAMSVWRLGVFSETTGWPTCGTYYENRFWLAGAVVNRIDATQVLGVAGPTGPFNFGPTDRDGTVSDNNGISAPFKSEETNTVYWMSPSHSGIVVGTQGGEWVIQASALNDPLTPSSVQAHRQTKYRCANVEPRNTGMALAFVQAFGRKVYEYISDVYSGKFTGTNLSADAKHLTASTVVELAYQQELAPVVWARRGDGKLIGMTYRRDSPFGTQAAAFSGWHQHELGSGRTVTSIQTGPSLSGATDTLTMITTDGTTHWIEVLTDVFEEGAELADAWHLDAGASPTVVASTGTYITLEGYEHLAGKTVSFTADGLDMGDFLVGGDGGVGVLISAANGLMTEAQLLAANWVGGYTYTSQGQVLRALDGQQSGAANGPSLAKVRRSHQMGALVVNTQKISFGTDFTHLRPGTLATQRGDLIADTELYEGVIWDIVDDTYSFDSQLCWEIRRPYPAAVLAIGQFLATQDR